MGKINLAGVVGGAGEGRVWWAQRAASVRDAVADAAARASAALFLPLQQQQTPQPQQQQQAAQPPRHKARPPHGMPSARGPRRGWCPGSCFQKDEPPEITYCVVDQAGALSLHALTPTQPMPPPDELDAKFAELVEELDLTAPNKAAMLGLPAEKKWQIYCSKKKDQEGVTDLSHNPEHYIHRVNAMSTAWEGGGAGVANGVCSSAPSASPSASQSASAEEEEARARTRHLEGLRTALRTQPHSFVLRFVELQGLPALLRALQALDRRQAQLQMQAPAAGAGPPGEAEAQLWAAGAQRGDGSVRGALIGCLKALMNNSNGRAHVLAHPTGINVIAQSLSTESIKTKIAVLEILGAVCLVPGGHKKVLEAMQHYQTYAFERTRFQGIINDLDRDTGVYRDEVSLKTAIMSFVNAVLNYGPGQENLEFRLHLRYEFLMLGIQPIIDKLRRHENETLDRHLDFFEMVRNEDEKELAKKFEKEHVDTKSATAMFELLRKKLSHTAAYPHLLSLLQHCLLLPWDCGSHPQHWLLFDRIVQQIVHQAENGSNPDMAPIDLNVKELVHLLAKEEELVAARTKAEELEKENSDLLSRLAKKEQELDQRSQEKEDLEVSLRRGKERLEKETAAHLESKQRLAQLEHQLNELAIQLETQSSERLRLERLVATGSLPDDTKALGLQTSLGSPAPPPPPLPLNGYGPPPPAPPPPPPLAPAAPPPPAPPSAPMPPCPPAPAPPGGNGCPATPTAPAPPVRQEQTRKNVPQPSAPLKSFNWSKLPDAKVNGTIWSELDETKLYTAMELENIDKIFCAYQKNGVTNEGSIEDLRQLGKSRAKILSVIDGRRAQNCTILLSKLKMSDEDISKAIMSMDGRNQLPIDMVELLLNFIPSAEECALLEEHSEDIENLARADRFLYEISKIPHYEQRLRSLHYKKRFGLWVSEVQPRIRSVMEASREVARSRRLRRLLEVVLALGNYMNRGARGNAFGFRLGSLNRLADTKSSALKGTTLLHYLVEILEKKFKDTLKLDEDLPHIREAAKVNMGELEKDMGQLRNGLKEVEREVEFHRSQPAGVAVPGDRFLPVMKEFLTSATCRFSELEDLFQDMKTRFDRAVRLFGEDNTNIQPDEFFGIFDAFLSAFNEARQDNENMRRRREEEEKRAQQEAEMKKRTMDRKNSKEGILSKMGNSLKNGLSNGLSNGRRESSGDAKGEFDDLISALRTGDVFGEDMAKFKRSRKSRLNTNGSSPTRLNSLNREDSRERVLNSNRKA